jgi:hypothetical protein
VSTVADRLDLCTLEGLTKAVAYEPPGSGQRLQTIDAFDGTFCPACNDERRMVLVCLYWQDRWAPGARRRFDGPVLEGSATAEAVPGPPAAENPDPALFVAGCVQCDSQIVLLVVNGPNGVELITLPSTYGGPATPNTPKAVAFYLDQAQRSQAVGALTAAVTMYRAALEHVLEEQGYQERMLGPKISALLDDDDPAAMEGCSRARLPQGDQGPRKRIDPHQRWRHREAAGL